MRIKPKKKLGQNFLIDKNVQKKIIAACELRPGEVILEIGAGRGELTNLISDKVAKVFAVELDSDLCQTLRDRFSICPNVEIINCDILKLDIANFFKKIKRRIKIIGNIPYYITSPLIEHLLKFKNKIEVIFITVQKEFAKRIVAKPGSKDYGSFSCFVQYYAETKNIFFIKKGCFFPSPKVDSCFLRLDIRERPIFKLKNKKFFFNIIRTAFNKRRKMLKNSLKDTISSAKLSIFFEKYNKPANIRPEQLSLKDFANLANL